MLRFLMELTILLLSITACIIIEFFEINSMILCSLIGAIFLCFPTVTSTMFFMYTAPYYALAILLAVLAAWFADGQRFGMVYGSILCAFSLGIYQAYLPLTVSLLILKMLQNSLSKQRKIEKFSKEGFCFFYFSFWCIDLLDIIKSLSYYKRCIIK